MRKAKLGLLVALLILTATTAAQAGWIEDARAQIQAREYIKALQTIENEGDSSSVDGLHLRAEANFEMGRVLDAEKDLKAALEIDETLAEAHALLALVYARQRAVELAKKHADRGVELNQNAATLYGRAIVFLAQGKVDSAMTDIEAALALDPKISDYHRARGAIFRIRGKYDEAMAEFKIALENDKRPYKTYLEMASLYVLRGDPVNAKRDINKSVQIAPELYYGYLGRAAVREAYKEYEAALADYRKALALAPQVAELYFNISNLLVGLGRIDEAEKVLVEARKVCADIPDWYVMMSLVQSTLKKPTEALATLNELIRRTPDEWQGYTLRGQLHGAQGRLDEALADFDHAIAIAPKAPEPKLNKAKVLLGQKKPEAALQIINDMIAEYPESMALYQMRMAVFEAQGRAKEALADLEKIEQLKKKGRSQ
ncbi:MAG: tetratricopeptide repeat protein [Candidatus Lernaella stagnicola]|nr:tetratricopeptide repeat protein [Candidatus Lernaella stagnicola]